MRNRYFLLVDLPLLCVAALTAFVLRFDLRFDAYHQEFLYFIAVALTVKPLTFYAAGVYGRYWPYASVADLVALMLAGTGASMLVGATLVASLWIGVLPAFSRSVVVIDWLVTLALIGGLRAAFRVIAESQRHGRPLRDGVARETVLLAGAGQAGMMVLRDLQNNPQLGMDIVGFLDDDPLKVGKLIGGLPVLGRLDDLAEVAKVRHVTRVIIAMPTAPGSVVRRIAAECRSLALTSMVIPGIFELVGGQVTVGRLREVQISDLLRRSHVSAEVGAGVYIAGLTVMVTGAGGSIGREICRQVAGFQPKLLVMLGHGENSLVEACAHLLRDYPAVPVSRHIVDVRNDTRLRAVFSAFAPAVVFHAAAYKHVSLMEENPEEAISNNAKGTMNVVRAALGVPHARVVLVSTDKAAAPVGLMGASKRLAEELVRQSARRFSRDFVVVRFGNVLGSRGSVVPIFQQQIEQGGPVTVTSPEMKRFFMTIPEAAHLVIHAAALGTGGELFVLRMGEPVAVVDLARDMIRLSGAGDIPIVFTGARAGEKIQEILWEPGAIVTPTAHPEILSVQEPAIVADVDWAAAIEYLTAVAATENRDMLVAELSRYLPTFSAPQRAVRRTV